MDPVAQGDVIHIACSHAGILGSGQPVQVVTDRPRLVEPADGVKRAAAREHRAGAGRKRTVIPCRVVVRRARLAGADERLGQSQHDAQLRALR